jgi:hypothetical protein
MAYSALTHPLPPSRIHLGTSGTNDAVQSTRVRPIEMRTEPGVDSVKGTSSLTSRNSSDARSDIEADPGNGECHRAVEGLLGHVDRP